MKYIKFKLPEKNTETKKNGIVKNYIWKIIEYVLRKIIPESNPTNGKLIDDVEFWLIECEIESGIPVREIGIDRNENVILKMPHKKDYGYWTDEDLLLKDFVEKFHAIEIKKNDFEENWKKLIKNKKRTHNSGLLQWLLPDFPTENPLLNGMFCYICNGLVLVQRH